MSDDDRLTPARRQYLALKRKHPDALLLYRMGDFYELFDDDAVVASRDLHITLTSREFGKGNRVPMAGVPHHALSSYLRRLLARGHRVAIGEQLSEPGHGLVERDVVRVISPGTVVEPGLLAARENNYLVGLNPGRDGTGLAYIDVSTGEFGVTEFAAGEETGLAAELARLAPAECLLPVGRTAPQPPPCPLTHCPPRWFQEAPARERLLRHFAVASLEPFGCVGLPLGTGAAAAVLAYVEGTNRDLLRLVRGLRSYSTAGHVTLDAYTRRNLEITRASRSGERAGSLLSAVDQTRTSMGGRMLRRWLNRPLSDVAALNRRLDVVEALVSNHDRRSALLSLFDRCGDIERLSGRARQGVATPRDLFALAAGLRAAADVAAVVRCDDVPAALAALVNRVDAADDVSELIERAVSNEDGRTIRPGYDPELDELIATVGTAQRTLLDLEARERARTGIRSLKVGFNKVFGYYIEVTRANLRAVPTDFIRRQTLANGERFVTPELKEWEARILRAEERISGREGQVFAAVVEAAGAQIDRLLATAEAIAELDVLTAFAEVAACRRYTRPELDTSTMLHIEGGRHPVVELTLDEGGFVANDTVLEEGTAPSPAGGRGEHEGAALHIANRLEDWSSSPAAARGEAGPGALSGDISPSPATRREPSFGAPYEDISPSPATRRRGSGGGGAARLLLITGPNMAGKSTYLRQVALIVLLAQVGSFVPVERARVGLVDRIFTRVGAQDDLAAGASTFLVEMVETAAILRHATERSLLIFDEIGRGTSTFDGLSIAQAVMEDVHDRIGARTLFATHFHELTVLTERLPGMRNLNVAALEDGGRVVFLRRVVPGSADRSYGIHVARLAGLPEHVTARAEALLAEMEAGQARSAPTAASRTAAESGMWYAARAAGSCPACAAERTQRMLSAVSAVNLAATTPIEALNFLFRLQESAADAELPCPHAAAPPRLSVIGPMSQPTVSGRRDGPRGVIPEWRERRGEATRPTPARMSRPQPSQSDPRHPEHTSGGTLTPSTPP